jgi:hypothetical protein
MEPVQQQHIPSFVRLVEKLEEHNNNHGLGAQIGRGLANMMLSVLAEEESAEDSPADPQSKSREAPQQLPTPAQGAEAIFKEFSRTLHAMGLELVQNRGEADIALLREQYGLEQPKTGAVKADTVSFEIVDGEKLVAFLKSTTLRDLHGEQAANAMNVLARALDQEFVHQYIRSYLDTAAEDPAAEDAAAEDPAAEDAAAQRWKDLQGPLLEVASELTRLNLKEAAARVVLHVEQAIDGTLVEYCIAESKNMLADTNTFNARRWHEDSLPEDYSKRWSEAVDAARQINENPKAAKIFERVHKFLTESADFAVQDIQRHLDGSPSEYWRDYGPQKLETLQGVLVELAILKQS